MSEVMDYKSRLSDPASRKFETFSYLPAMDADNIKEMHGNIYTAKVNGIVPWACIQRPAKWVGGDPNPGTAFRVQEDGSFEVLRGYYFYKQVSRAGQPGTAVAWTMAMDSETCLIGFAKNGSKHPDAFVRTVSEKLLIYALGRGLQSYDPPVVRRIVRDAAAAAEWEAALRSRVPAAAHPRVPRLRPMLLPQAPARVPQRNP